MTGCVIIGTTTLSVLLLLTGCASGPRPATNPTALMARPEPAAPIETEREFRKEHSPEQAARAARPAATSHQTKPKQTACKVMSDTVDWVLISGGCKDGYAHGEGHAKSVTGKRRYSGGFSEGFFSGNGTYDWGNGTRYTGGFRQGKKHGQGTLTCGDKSSYSGPFQENVYHGRGTYVSADGSTYTGDFAQGSFDGRGTYTWKNGTVYDGEFRNNKMEGEGTYTLANSERFTGQFRNNEMSQGVYTWPNGDRYEGPFQDNEMDGEGTYTYADGSKYAGRFAKGKKDGEGTLFIGNDAIRQVWKDGEKAADLR